MTALGYGFIAPIGDRIKLRLYLRGSIVWQADEYAFRQRDVNTLERACACASAR